MVMMIIADDPASKAMTMVMGLVRAVARCAASLRSGRSL
jgi:hypothetical protein